MDICFFCVDYKESKVLCSKIIYNKDIDKLLPDDKILDSLKKLVNNKKICFYENKLTPITLKSVKEYNVKNNKI